MLLIILVEMVSLIALHVGLSPDVITFTLMNIQTLVAMKGITNMRQNSLGVVLTCICGVV